MTQLNEPTTKSQNEKAETTTTEGELNSSYWTSVTRVANYPVVTNLVETAKGYYTAAKEVSPTAQLVGEKIEASVQGGYKWIAPKVEPVLQSQTVQKYAKTVDEKLNQGLDSLETRVEKLKEVRTSLEGRVETLKATTYTAIEGADSYLKESVVGKPLTAALNATEKYLPGGEETTQEGDERQDGPIFHAARISVRLQQQALAKLKDLSLRSPDKNGGLQYTIDLIQYAATSLDSGVAAVGGKLVKGVTDGAHYVYEAPKQISKEAADKIVHAARETVDALNATITALSKQLPEPVSARVQQTVDVLKHTAESLKLRAEGVDLTLFYNIAKKGSESLHSLTNTLSGYVARGEEVPAQLLHTASSSVRDILDNLVGYLNKNTTATPAEQTN